MARQLESQAGKSQGKDEQISVLSAGPIKEIDLSPPGNRISDDVGQPVDRAVINPAQVAPIMRDAREAPPVQPSMGLGAKPVMQGTPEDKVPKVRTYRVEQTKQILDETSQSRTTLREGKEISEGHYNIRSLQRQGVKLRDITNVDPNAPLS